MMTQETSEALSRQSGGPRFELIPSRQIVERAVAALPHDATLTITSSPSQGVDATVETSIQLAADFYRVIPHIAARMVSDEAHLDAVLDKLLENNINEVFIVGGDQGDPLGPYHRGYDLLSDLSGRENAPQRIGIPAYPEGHPNIGQETLDEDLTAKASFADYAVTQMCFDSDQVLDWLYQQRENGLQLPFYLGIPGPVRPDKLLRIAPRIGVTDSLRFLRKNLKLSGKLLRGYDPSELLKAYMPHFNDPDYGIAGFHTYTFNELDTFKNMSSE